jgi:hypothetical protein
MIRRKANSEQELREALALVQEDAKMWLKDMIGDLGPGVLSLQYIDLNRNLLRTGL